MFGRFLVFVIIGLPFFSNAQLSEEILIKSGENVTEVLSKRGLYLLPAFSNGEVRFKDGTATTAMMNFNIYLNQIQFISKRGDTLIIAKPALVDSVFLDTATFYYKDGYKQVLEGTELATLGLERKISVRFIKKGALGANAPVSAAVETVEDYYVSGNYWKLGTNHDVIITKQIYYFIVYNETRRTPANAQGFQKAFPNLKKQIKDFAAANNIDYKEENDLKRLFKFCLSHS